MKQSKFKELFGFGKGWGTIIYCLLMFWFYAGADLQTSRPRSRLLFSDGTDFQK